MFHHGILLPGGGQQQGVVVETYDKVLQTDAIGDYLSRTASVLDNNAPYTMFGRFKIDTDRGGYGHFFHVGGSYAFDGRTDFVGVDTDGTNLRMGAAGGGAGSYPTIGPQLPIGSWFWLALVRSSTTSLNVYYGTNASDGVLAGTVTDSVASREAATLMTVMDYNSSPILGRAAHVRLWDAALSLSELHTEFASQTPVRQTNLWSYTQLSGATVADAIQDRSTNDRDWTAVGTMALVDEDFGTLFTQAVSGSVAAAGAMAREVGKGLAGAITGAGAVTRAIAKAISGALTSIGGLATNFLPAPATGPTFVNVGAWASGSGALTVAQPAGTQVDDLLLLVVESANEVVNTPSGWTIAPSSPQSIGTAAAIGAVRVSVFYKWDNGAEGSVTVADSGNHTTASILAYRGVNTTTPFNANAGSTQSATTAMVFPGVTTTVNNCMIFMACGQDTDANSTATSSGETNANLTDLIERVDRVINSGVGGGIVVLDGKKATAGATGDTTATGSTSVTHAYVTLALAPAVVNAFTQAVGGVITALGAVQRSLIFSLAIQGSIAMAGAMSKAVSKVVAGAIAGAGAASKAVARTLSGAITGAGAAVKETARTLAGAITASSVLDAVYQAAANLYEQAVGGVISATGSVSRATSKGLGGVITGAGAVSRAITRTLSGAITGAGAAVKETSRALAGVITGFSTLGTQLFQGAIQYTQAVGGFITATGAVARAAILSQILAGSLTVTGALRKLTSRSIAGAVTAAGALSRRTGKLVAGSLTLAGSATRAIARRLTGALTAMGATTPAVTLLRGLVGAITGLGAVSRVFVPFMEYVGSSINRAHMTLRRFISRR